jgi:hypothetical protein
MFETFITIPPCLYSEFNCAAGVYFGPRRRPPIPLVLGCTQGSIYSRLGRNLFLVCLIKRNAREHEWISWAAKQNTCARALSSLIEIRRAACFAAEEQ